MNFSSLKFTNWLWDSLIKIHAFHIENICSVKNADYSSKEIIHVHCPYFHKKNTASTQISMLHNLHNTAPLHCQVWCISYSVAKANLHAYRYVDFGYKNTLLNHNFGFAWSIYPSNIESKPKMLVGLIAMLESAKMPRRSKFHCTHLKCT